MFRFKKLVKNIFKENTVNTIFLKLQLIYSTVRISRVAIAQLCNDLQVCNFILSLTQKYLYNTFKGKKCKCNSFVFTTDLLNSENLKVDIAQLCNQLQVCNLLCYMLTPKT